MLTSIYPSPPVLAARAASSAKVNRITQVVEYSAACFGVDPIAMVGLGHSTRTMTLARHVAMSIIRGKLGLNYSNTAAIFRRDPDTAKNGCVRVARMLRESEQFRELYHWLASSLDHHNLN